MSDFAYVQSVFQKVRILSFFEFSAERKIRGISFGNPIEIERERDYARVLIRIKINLK